MISAGIREVKNNLSRLLAQVKAGQDILITDRGKPIARIVKADEDASAVRTALASLVESGLVELPSRGLCKENMLAVTTGGKPAAEMVIEDRR